MCPCFVLQEEFMVYNRPTIQIIGKLFKRLEGPQAVTDIVRLHSLDRSTSYIATISDRERRRPESVWVSTSSRLGTCLWYIADFYIHIMSSSESPLITKKNYCLIHSFLRRCDWTFPYENDNGGTITVNLERFGRMITEFSGLQVEHTTWAMGYNKMLSRATY